MAKKAKADTAKKPKTIQQYTIKVQMKGCARKIKRIFTCTENTTLEDLSNAIAEAFNLIDHYYSLSCPEIPDDIIFDPFGGIEDGDEYAAYTLKEVPFLQKSKFKWVYDFGADMMFEGVVTKIKEVEVDDNDEHLNVPNVEEGEGYPADGVPNFIMIDYIKVFDEYNGKIPKNIVKDFPCMLYGWDYLAGEYLDGYEDCDCDFDDEDDDEDDDEE